jgi:integrase
MRKSPSTFSDDDLRGWAQLMVERRHDYKYVQRVQHRFRKQLLQAGLAVKVPGIFRNWKPPIKYAVPLSELPQPLQREILALLKWKQADYAPSRRASSRLRPVSASRLQSAFTHLYGFLVNIMPGLPDCNSQINPDSIRTMIELVTRESVTAYIDWYINVRQLKGRPLASKLGQMSAALKEHPSYRDKGFEWLDDLIHGIPHESESAQRERKERKYLPYEILQNVPHRIHQTRQDAAKESAKALAIVVRNELLMQWIVVLPWRQRNIRECRVGLKSEGANLFKSEIEQWDSIKKPKWVQQALQRNPHEQFWQYHFRESETKNGREVRSIVPRRLVALLEEYLKQHRGNLIQGSDPGTLLLNDDGRPLTDSRVTTLVSKLTLRHAGRRVTPHIFRDIWAYWWLASHPEDYLTVSKRLWHRNLQTTLRIYGCKFDEAQADCRVEDWLESHE